MPGVTFLKGVGIASTAAGPLFMAAAFATALPGGLLTGADTWPFALFAGLASVPVGFALAAIPNLFGAALLGALGCGNDATRLPVFWALVGAGLGAAIDEGIALTGGASGFVPLFTLVALASALLCRWGTRWTD